MIDDVRVELVHAFRDGDSMAVQSFYSGHLEGAPRPFRVPMATVQRLRGNLVVDDTDHYNLADVLRQSGLPENWTPPAS